MLTITLRTIHFLNQKTKLIYTDPGKNNPKHETWGERKKKG